MALFCPAVRRPAAAHVALATLLLACSEPPTAPRFDDASIVLTEADGTPVPDVNVVWEAPDGRVLAATVTDLHGIASAPIVPGSLVTYLQEIGGWVELSTIGGIQPGDRLHRVYWPAVDGAIVEQVLRWPGPLQGATGYTVDTGLDRHDAADVDQLRRISLHPRHLHERRFSLLAEALDADGRPIAHLSRLDAELGPELGLPAWNTAFAELRLEVGNAAGHMRITGWVSQAYGGAWFSPSDRLDVSPPELDELPVMTSLRLPSGFPADQTDVFVVAWTDDEESTTMRKRVFGRPSALRLDIDQTLPRVIGGGIELDERGGQIAWQTDRDPAGTDVVVVGASFRFDGTRVEWRAELAPATSSVRFPALPPDLARYRPSSNAQAFAAVTYGKVSPPQVGETGTWTSSGWERLRTEGWPSGVERVVAWRGRRLAQPRVRGAAGARRPRPLR